MSEQQPQWNAPQSSPSSQPPQSPPSPQGPPPSPARQGYPAQQPYPAQQASGYPAQQASGYPGQQSYLQPFATPASGGQRNTVGRLALALGLAAVALGLLSTVLQYLSIRSGNYAGAGWFTWIATPVLVAATVLGIIGLRQPGRPRGAAAAGLALGASPLLGLAFNTLLFSTL